jgi:hypothetical protein
MVCKQEPAGKKPALPGLVKLDVMSQSTPSANYQPVVIFHNILHVKWSDNSNHSAADLKTLATDFRGFWVTALGTYLSQNYQLQSITAQSLGGDGQEGVDGTTVAYGGVGVPCSPQCAVAISWKAAFSWRGGRPRTYLGGIPTTALNVQGSGALTPTYAGNIATAGDALISQTATVSIGGASVALGFPSYYSNCQLRPTPLWYPFQSAVCHQRLDTQRRRLGKEAIYAVHA